MGEQLETIVLSQHWYEEEEEEDEDDDDDENKYLEFWCILQIKTTNIYD